jgi:multiple antibiotic resistance protein
MLLFQYFSVFVISNRCCIAAFTGFLFSFESPLSKRLGVSGMGVVTRVMGMILAAIAMGMLAEGLKGMLPGRAG